jgi:hypothetical protein
LALARLRQKKNAANIIAIAPTATPTPIPAFAPSESPDAVELLLVEDVLPLNTAAIVIALEVPQQLVLLPQHQVVEFAVPSHGVTRVSELMLPSVEF